ncbi:MAG: hypothetical protein H6668_17065 [Ardenticatenaceae bacterium]|nr:hypothetical protein [Ardenticatenaceae bacterium]
MTRHDQDEHFRELFLAPIRKCAEYQPVFGQGKRDGLSLAEFQTVYGGDLFYAWLGLDNPAVYAAHKAAGGLTSVYRQLGIGSERLFRAIIAESLNLSETQMEWSYEYVQSGNQKGIHTLDACIRLTDLDSGTRKRFVQWLAKAKLLVAGNVAQGIHVDGIVFEVRQGYKSADSKRQNADLRFGIRAYQANLLPVFVIMSSQMSEPVISRYRSDGMLVLTGVHHVDPTISTFAFFDQVVGYNLAEFFTRNRFLIQDEIKKIVEKLLSP